MTLFLIFPIWAIGAIIGFPCIVIYAIHRCCSKEKHNEDVEGGQPNGTGTTTLPSTPCHENTSFVPDVDIINEQTNSNNDNRRRDVSRRNAQNHDHKSDERNNIKRSKSSELSANNRGHKTKHHNRGRDHSCPERQNRVSDNQNQSKEVFPGQRKYTELEVTKTGKQINLHGMLLQDALSETEKYLKLTVQEYINTGCLRINRFFSIITGKGNHSKEKGKPVIKPEVEKFLNNHLFTYNIPPENPGRIVVDFWKSKDSHYF